MFFHTLKYSLKSTVRTKEITFWTLLFPFVLGTLFFLAFGNAFESTEVFSKIPVAVVETDNKNSAFSEILKSFSTEAEDSLFVTTFTDEKYAKQSLKNNDVTGIFFVGDEITLTVKEDGLYQTVLKVFLEQYQQTENTINEIISVNPSGVQSAINVLSNDTNYYNFVDTARGAMDPYVQYFYALIAMSCLYACFLSLDRTVKLQADLSPLGQRRGVAPTRKLTVIASEFMSCLLIQFLVECALLIYLTVILKIDFGNRIPQMLLLMFFGSAFGVALGVFIGAIPRISEGVKTGISTSVCMILSFCSGLMFSGMRLLIEHTFPIFNRLNPAALIVDSFYALNVFDTYERFATNMITLAFMTLILCVASVFMTRRNKYASL
ncbi:MAG: ABC transporter permease [Oscillospiraceae bacterium]|nr:ABC transporter permease [Oscillospiraceae bacterium]